MIRTKLPIRLERAASCQLTVKIVMAGEYVHAWNVNLSQISTVTCYEFKIIVPTFWFVLLF